MALIALMLLVACGGGGQSAGTVPTPSPTPVPVSLTDVRRFLTQATFGVTDAEVQKTAALGLSGWLDAQLSLPLGDSCVTYMDARAPQLAADPRGGFSLGKGQFYEYFYHKAATAPDQLRQRVAFALSQIFVISMQNDAFTTHPRMAGSYYDRLAADAFGNYRTLLEDVTLHPAMGCYLSSMNNLPENPVSGSLPNENYAREILQLMSIGLYQLNPDGSRKLDALGQAMPTYSHDDVGGLAKVFTGFGWYAPFPSDQTFWNGVGSDSETRPMTLYPEFHSNSGKVFLDTTLPPAAAPDPAGDLKAALDTIFNHPNVGPFLAKGLIKQLVTSNPSTAYVGRVASVFNDNGKGARGELASVIRAILLDPEARDLAGAQNPAFGKLREPVLRLTQWMRAFNAYSQSGDFQLGNTDAEAFGLGQSPLNAPSVFNFWAPQYLPPMAGFAGTGLVAPEFQGVDEVSVAGYLNFMQTTLAQGCGGGSNASPATVGADINSAYTPEVQLAGDPAGLVARMDLLLLCGTMTAALRDQLVAAVSSVPLPGVDAPEALAQAQLNRVKLAAFLVLASPEFLHQR